VPGDCSRRASARVLDELDQEPAAILAGNDVSDAPVGKRLGNVVARPVRRATLNSLPDEVGRTLGGRFAIQDGRPNRDQAGIATETTRPHGHFAEVHRHLDEMGSHLGPCHVWPLTAGIKDAVAEDDPRLACGVEADEQLGAFARWRTDSTVPSPLERCRTRAPITMSEGVTAASGCHADAGSATNREGAGAGAARGRLAGLGPAGRLKAGFAGAVEWVRGPVKPKSDETHQGGTLWVVLERD